jgi:hypothetical protein
MAVTVGPSRPEQTRAAVEELLTELHRATLIHKVLRYRAHVQKANDTVEGRRRDCTVPL